MIDNLSYSVTPLLHPTIAYIFDPLLIFQLIFESWSVVWEVIWLSGCHIVLVVDWLVGLCWMVIMGISHKCLQVDCTNLLPGADWP